MLFSDYAGTQRRAVLDGLWWSGCAENKQLLQEACDVTALCASSKGCTRAVTTSTKGIQFP